MPTRYVYDIKREGERFISYTYRIRHDLCNVMYLCRIRTVLGMIYVICVTAEFHLRVIKLYSTHFIRYKVRAKRELLA